MAEEVKIEETEVNSLRHPLQERAEMDVVLAVKNLLALEDHLREFMPESEEEERWRMNVLKDVEQLRTEVFLLIEEHD